MVEVYNKYNKLEITFEHINNICDALQKIKIFKIKAKKLIFKTLKKIHVYFCKNCKKRNYVENVQKFSNCNYCNSTQLYFVGFKNSNIPEETIYEI